jgi:hypothetical protein
MFRSLAKNEQKPSIIVQPMDVTAGGGAHTQGAAIKPPVSPISSFNN